MESSVRYLANNIDPAGIRVNANSAGLIKTPAAARIAGFRKNLGHVEENAPLPRTDLAAGMTGEIACVDAGYNILGMIGISND